MLGNFSYYNPTKLYFSFVLAVLTVCSCSNGNPETVQDQTTVSEALTGHFVSDYDGSSLTVSTREDGRYDIEIDLFRLTLLDDGIGDDSDGGIDFTATDAAGEPIGGHISIADSTATLTFVHSTWSLIEEGAKWEFKRE
jgi:hypothetical protein